MFSTLFSMAHSRAKRLLFLWAIFNTLSAAATPTPTPTTTASSSTTATAGLTFGRDITNFIPSCALACFQSFVKINFNTNACGFSPSLPCLCQHTSSTGYTIGEGATECIVAENSIGNCRNASYRSETVHKAYGMCNNIPNAAPKTHATLVATLVVHSGSIVLASPTGKPAANRSSTTTAMTPTPTPASTSASTTRPPAALTPAAVTSGTAAATPSASSSATVSSSLTRAQIGGIVGGIAAAAVLAALLALFLCLRRRRRRLSPAFSRMRDSSWPGKPMAHGSPGDSLPISQPRYLEPKVMSFTRALAKRVSSSSSSSKPGRRPWPSHGLAISPAGTAGGRKLGTGVGLDRVERSPVGTPPPPPPPPPAVRSVYVHVQSSPERPLPPTPPVPPMSPDRALSSFNFLSQSPPRPQPQRQPQPQPRRPTLALAIPQRVSVRGGRRGGHDSVVTEFAEDSEDGRGSAQIWRPPRSADPNSAAATQYYVADKWGNWVLREEHGSSGQRVATAGPSREAAGLVRPVSESKGEGEGEGVVVIDSAAARERRQRARPPPMVPDAVAASGSDGTRTGAAGARPTIRLVTPESGRLPVNSRGRRDHSGMMPQHVALSPEEPMLPRAPAHAGHGVAAAWHHGSMGGRRPWRRSSKHDARRPPPPRARQASRDSASTIMSMDSATTATMADSSPVEAMINAALDDLAFPRSLPPPPPPQRSSNHQNNNTNITHLSPVAESPAAGRASPVRYPHIPRAQSTTTTTNTTISSSSNRYSALGPSKQPLPNPRMARLAAGPQQQQQQQQQQHAPPPTSSPATHGVLAARQATTSPLPPPTISSRNPHLRPAGTPAPTTTTTTPPPPPPPQQQQQVLRPASDRAQLPSQQQQQQQQQQYGSVLDGDGCRYDLDRLLPPPTAGQEAPGWKPMQLTPKRKGGDLYLSVQ